MSKGFITLVFVFLFIFSTFITITVGDNKRILNTDEQLYIFNYRGKTLYVGGSGPGNYSRIQDAIDNASDGDTVFVYEDSSPYYETIVVNKSINLIGEHRNKTYIDGMYGKYIVHITKDNVNIMNFTLRHSGGYLGNAGIKIDSKNSVVTKCIFYRTKTGIFINKTNSCEINNCIFYTNGEGIYIKSSIDVNIKDSYFCHNCFGLDLQDSNKITITGCYADTNGYGFYIYNSSNIDIRKCAIYNNNDNQGGIFLKFCNDIEISNCNIYHNGQGIRIARSENIRILRSDIIVNTHGAINLLKNNENIYIENCEIAHNINFGLLIASNNTCKLVGNNIYHSLFGLHSRSSQCDARRNWWGSFFGPALFEREIKDRLYIKGVRIRLFFPWLLFKNKNAGSNWQINNNLFYVEINGSRFIEIELPGIDSDKDNVPDWWEEKWDYNPSLWDDHKNLDPDEDALTNIEECYTDQYGSSPFYKDIFLEIDWVEETDPTKPNKPPSDLIEELVKIFKDHSINLHIDVGELGGGEEIPFIVNFTLTDLRDMYWDYFLHNDLNSPRKGIFHYALLCDSGVFGGFTFVGWDSLDSFNIAVGALSELYQQYPRDWVSISTILHELGHTLGLTVDDYRGIDNNIAATIFTYQWWKYRNYKSCLHYRYVFEVLDYSDGSNGREDFNDWDNIDFGFFKNTHFKLPKNGNYD